MTTQTMPVDGPYRVYVRRIPTGAELDMSHLIGRLIVALAHDFEADPADMGDELLQIADADRAARGRGPDTYAAHDRDQRVQHLLDTIGGGVQAVYGDQVHALATALLAAAAPGQQAAA
jgi:hypothetical protein